MRKNRGEKELRKGRQSIANTAYFITTNTYQGKKILTENNYPQLSHEALSWLEKQQFIYLHCYIIMPDHIHLVITLTGEKDLSSVMQSFKGYTYKKISEVKSSGEKQWQAGYFDHRIRENERFKQILYYCFQNP